MKKRVLLSYLAVAMLAAVDVAHATSEEKLLAQALAMTPGQFQSSITIKDDELDTTAEIDTSKGFQAKRGLLKVVWNDNFLRAFIDKKTGATRIQVYEFIMYEGAWRFYNSVNFETPTGPRSEPVTSIAKNVVSCAGSRYGSGCTLIEHVAFNVDESLLRTIASLYSPGTPVGWKYKFGAQRAEDWNSGILPAEIVGFLAEIDGYRNKHGLIAPVSTNETKAGHTVASDATTEPEIKADLRRRAKEAIDRGDLKAAKDFMDMLDR